MAQFEAQLRSAKMLTGTATKNMQTGMNNVAAATKKTSAAMKLLKVAIGAIGFIALAMAFKKIVQATAQFEDAQLELRKTSGMTREEIDKFSNRMKNMASTMPTSTTGLLEIAAAAARLGIQGSNNLADFSETVIKMATATQYTEEQASLDFAKIANVMKLPYAEIGRLGSAMNELANTTTATAPIIGDFTRRVAGAGSTLNLTIPQLTAMGATLNSLGVETQVAGTAMSNFFTKMLTQAKTFADQAGMALEEWNHLVEVDAWEALQKWLTAMDKMKPIERAQALGELKMAGARMTDTLMKLSGAQEKLNVNLATSQKAFEENTSLQKEYEIALEGLSAQWNIFTGNVVNLAITIGAKLSPALKQVMKGLNVLIDGLQFLIKNWSEVWQAAYQILIVTLEQIGHGIKKFFTDWSTFKAGLNLWYEYGKALLMIMTRTLEMLAGLIARASSVIWAPYIKTLQWVADNMVYYFRLAIEDVRNAIIKGVNWITSNAFTPMANFFIDVANKMTEGIQVFVNFFIRGMNTVTKAIKPVINALGWFAKNILRKELPDSIKEFGDIAEVEFKKIEKLGKDALTIEIPESTLKQPAKFAARMGEAWKIIKDQYSKIPGDLRRYVDDLAMEWENVTRAATEFKEAVDWSDYKARLAEIIEKLKAAGVDTSALEKEQDKLNKTLDKTKGLLKALPGALGKVVTKLADYKTAITNLGAPTSKAYTGLFMIDGLLKSMPGALGKVITKLADYKTAITNLGAPMSQGNTALLMLQNLLKPMPGVLGKVIDKLADYKTAITNLGAPLSKAYTGLFVIEGLLKSLPGTLKKVKDKTADYITAIKNMGIATIKTYSGLSFLEGLLKSMPGIVKKVEDKTKDYITTIKNMGIATIKTYKNLSTLTGLLKSLPGALKKVKDKTADYITTIKNMGAPLSKAYTGLRLLESLLKSFPGVLVKVKKKTDDYIGAIKKISAPLSKAYIGLLRVEGLLKSMPGVLVKVEDKTNNWIGAIRNLGAATSKTYAGLSMLDGLLKATSGTLVKVKKKTDDYIGAIRNASPMFKELANRIKETTKETTFWGEAWKVVANIVSEAIKNIVIGFLTGTKTMTGAMKALQITVAKAFAEMAVAAAKAGDYMTAAIAGVAAAFTVLGIRIRATTTHFETAWGTWGRNVRIAGERVHVFAEQLETEFARAGLAISTTIEDATHKMGQLFDSQAALGASTREKLISELDQYYDYRELKDKSLEELLALSAETRVGIETGAIKKVEESEAEQEARRKDQAISRLQRIEDQYAKEDELIRRKIALTEIEIKLLEYKLEREAHGNSQRAKMLAKELDDMLKAYKESVKAFKEAEEDKQEAVEDTTKVVKKETKEQAKAVKDAAEDEAEDVEDATEDMERDWTDLTGDIRRETERTWGRTGAVPIALNEAINAMIGKIGTLPTRIDFDIIGNLFIPSIPQIPDQYFGIIGVSKGSEERHGDGGSTPAPLDLNRIKQAWIDYSSPLWRGAGRSEEWIAQNIISEWASNRADIIRRFKSAQIGIPYIPRAMPVIVHREEAILNPSQAREWRAGKGGGQGGTQVTYERGSIRMTVMGSINQQVDLEKAMDYLAKKQTERLRRP